MLHKAPPANVCAYVAAFYNRGRQKEMWGFPDPVDIAGDGKLRHVYLYDMGTAHVPVIIATTRKLAPEELANATEDSEVSFAGGVLMGRTGSPARMSSRSRTAITSCLKRTMGRWQW